MNKFELDITMECLGLEQSDSYYINGYKYYNNGKYFTIVEGRIPYELAKLISEKYDNKKYHIRVNGNSEYDIPTEDVYTYHIDTVEGLIAFISETQKYYFNEESKIDNINTFLNLVYKNILLKINPTMSISEWMFGRKNSKTYHNTLLRNRTSINLKLRKKINEFDNCVNPFCNGKIEIDNYGLVIHGDNEKDYNWFSISDEKSNIVLTTIRKEEGFVVKFYMGLIKPYEFDIYHYYDKEGEKIAFECYDEDCFNRTEYNLTTDIFEVNNKSYLATNDNKETIINILNKYIDIIKRHIYSKIENNHNNKRLSKIKKDSKK